jgi:hypothetical protein
MGILSALFNGRKKTRFVHDNYNAQDVSHDQFDYDYEDEDDDCDDGHCHDCDYYDDDDD